MISYQAPVSALPSAGLSFSVSVLTIIRSMISPGIFEESKTSVAPLTDFTSASCGFQVTTEVTSAVEVKTDTMSASEVLTTVMSFSDSLAESSARASR
jgi:hypothetical protein